MIIKASKAFQLSNISLVFRVSEWNLLTGVNIVGIIVVVRTSSVVNAVPWIYKAVLVRDAYFLQNG